MQTINKKGLTVKDLVTIGIFPPSFWRSHWWAASSSRPTRCLRFTAPLLQELIDRIDVYEVTGTGKNLKQQIKIHYKFVGYLELPSLARQHNYRKENRKGVAVEYVPNALPA